MLTFNNNITVILPLEDNEKNPLNYDKQLKAIGEAFGGLTLFKNVEGLWYDNNKKFTDKSQLLRLDFLRMNAQQLEALIELYEFLFLSQYAIFTTVNDKSIFLEPTNKKEFFNHLKKNY